MSRKNHKMVDGRLLQMDKRFSQLKQAQQVKINDWFYESYRNASEHRPQIFSIFPN